MTPATSSRTGKYRHSKHPAQGRAVPGNALVLDGDTVKFRLIAERNHCATPVHVDWVRFTCYLRNATFPRVDFCFSDIPKDVHGIPLADWGALRDKDMPAEWRINQINSILRTVTDEDYLPTTQALELAEELAIALGKDFYIHPEIRKGMDFYKHRWSIMRQGEEVGWVGYGATTDSPSKAKQQNTIHANLYGAACTFAEPGWNGHIADICEDRQAKITRVDLALDFFDGFPGGLDKVVQDFNAGLCNSGGRRLRCNMVGDWSQNPRDGRSFYFGSKEAGKQTNVYEKGHQLYGFDAGSSWIRAELRMGNKLRVLTADMLRNPADYFAGASDWHAAMLALADDHVTPQKIGVKPRLPVQTIQAEAHRALNWVCSTASASLVGQVRSAADCQLMP